MLELTNIGYGKRMCVELISVICLCCKSVNGTDLIL